MKKILIIFTGFSFALGQASHAGLFRLTNRQYGSATPTQQTQIDSLLDQIETQANANIAGANDPTAYGKALANSEATSATLLGADYTTKFNKALLGAQLIAGSKLSQDQSLGGVIGGKDKLEQAEGVGASSSIYAGMPLTMFGASDRGLIRWNDVRVFAGFMSVNRSFSELDLKVRSFSAKLQYRFLKERGTRLCRWNGIDITTGLVSSKVTLGFQKVLSETFSQTVNGSTATGVATGTGVVSGEITTFQIPIEVSTSVRLLYFLDFFGGLGLDLGNSRGKASGRLDNGNFSMNSTVSGVTATPTLDLVGTDKRGNLVDFRSFFGTQVELGVLAVEAHVNRGWFTGTWGVGAGVKGFF